MAKWMLFAALLLGALPAATQANYCLGVPLSIKDKSCAGPITCSLDEYCGPEAVCIPKKGLGAVCEDDEECPKYSICYSGDEEDVSKCVKSASPGEACVANGEPASAGNQCGSGLSCSSTTNTCIGGRYGDSCKADADCQNNKCTGGVCTGSQLGQDCITTSCQYGLVCNEENKCANRKSDGASCDFSYECSSDICTRTAPEANRTCVAHNSIKGGSYSEDEDACESDMSFRNYCLDGPGEYCTSVLSCGPEMLCMCGGDYLLSGFGTCRKQRCAGLAQAYLECTSKNCAGSFNDEYEGSCFNRACGGVFQEAISKCEFLPRIFS